MAAGAAEMMLGKVFVASLSLNDFDIERRPYHRNCGCALHNLKGVCVNGCSQKRSVSFPKKHSWADSSSISTSKSSSRSSLLDKSSTTAIEVANEGLQIDEANLSNSCYG